MSRALAVLAVLAICVVAPAAVWAHGGTVIGSGSSEGYTMTVQTSVGETKAGELAADLTAYPIRRSNGSPATDVTVTFTVDGGRPLRATGAAGAYDVLVPMESRDEWREWKVTATADGPAGTLTVNGSGEASASTSGEGAPGWAVPSAIVLVVVGVGLVILRRRRVPSTTL